MKAKGEEIRKESNVSEKGARGRHRDSTNTCPAERSLNVAGRPW